MDKKYTVYSAGGWFVPRDDKILTFIEDSLSSYEDIKVYRPRKDGVKLSAEDFHDHNLRKAVFQSNVENIDYADFLVSLLDAGSERLDTGTVWETAYAVAKGIPVMAYQDDRLDSELINRLGFFHIYLSSLHTGRRGFRDAVTSMEHISNSMMRDSLVKIDRSGKSPVFLCDSTGNHKELAVLLDTLPRLKVVVDPKNSKKELKDIINAPYIIVPTDTKDSNLTFYMGMAYALGTPLFTYSSSGAPLNLMLIFSVVKHMMGLEDLSKTISKVNREGVKSFGEYDTSSMKVY